MQIQSTAATNNSGGKLESIKNIGTLVPQIATLVKQCNDARGRLEEMLHNLKSEKTSQEQAKKDREEQERKQSEYAELIAQRKAEREEAEKKVDARTESRLALNIKIVSNEKESYAKVTVKEQQPTGQPAGQTTQTVRPTAPAPQQSQQRTNTNNEIRRPSQPWSSGRGFGQRDDRGGYQGNSGGYQGGGYQGNRPPYQNGYQGGGYQGSRPGLFGGQRSAGGAFGQNRAPYGQNGYQGTRPPYQNGYQGNRQGGTFGGPRPAGTFGTGVRPYTPGQRPAGGARPLGGIKPTEKFVPKVDTFSAKKKVKTFDNSEKTAMDRRALLRRGIIEEQEIEERMLTRIFRTKKSKEGSDEHHEQSNIVVINTHNVSVKTLSEKIGKPVTEIIKQLMVLGNMCTINSAIDFDTASLVAGEFGFELQLNAAQTFEEKLGAAHKADDVESDKLETRPPVVTVMGHVDHGKTSLLDTIRKTKVQAGEHGGITQAIGAYQVKCNDKKITFIDTPGHAAFEKMRARGASLTDIAILIVAGDDGVMPQTVEAIKHIQKHKLPMIVAVNKMDKKEANIERVKEQLSTHNVLTEEWGGDAILVPISAVTGMGIDKLLEMILLVAEMNGYKANPIKAAQGVIIDGRKDAAIGGIVSLLVQSGTLRVGDTLLAGTCYGKVRKMTDENGKSIKSAAPSTPVQVLGFGDVPKAGDACYVVDEKLTRQVVLERKEKEKIKLTKASTKVASDVDAIAKLDLQAKTQLNLIIKSDVSGSIEAIAQTIAGITSDEVNINIISSGVGIVNDNDVALAEVASALLIAFNVKTSPTAVKLASAQKVKIHTFDVIYQIFDFVTEQMVRLFTPKFNEVYYGSAEVRAIFKSSAIGLIAGCMVKDGKIVRGEKAKLVRKDKEIGDYKIDSLKIKKDDTKEVAAGFECGIKLDSSVEIAAGDIIKCFGMEQQPIIYNGKKYEF